MYIVWRPCGGVKGENNLLMTVHEGRYLVYITFFQKGEVDE